MQLNVNVCSLRLSFPHHLPSSQSSAIQWLTVWQPAKSDGLQTTAAGAAAAGGRAAGQRQVPTVILHAGRWL